MQRAGSPCAKARATDEMAKTRKRTTRAEGQARRPKKRGKSALAGFLPCVSRWFGKTFEAPSPAQTIAWPVIRRGENTLLLAPTGSGKTLAAFLGAIDDLARRGQQGELTEGVQVLYITPLKALGNDMIFTGRVKRNSFTESLEFMVNSISDMEVKSEAEDLLKALA